MTRVGGSDKGKISWKIEGVLFVLQTNCLLEFLHRVLESALVKKQLAAIIRVRRNRGDVITETH